MLIKLNPGLVCKKCKGGPTEARMTIAKEIPGTNNIVLVEDKKVKKGDFECVIVCVSCMTQHHGEGFIRDGEFKGIHKYGIQA